MDSKLQTFQNLAPPVTSHFTLGPEIPQKGSMTVYPKSSLILNEHGFARTESRNIANKIWSIANDWTALITGRKNAKQVTLAMVIHRLTASKEVASILHKAGHSISYIDVRLQNEEWLSSLSDMDQLFSGLKKGTVTHSSLDNNDMRQDTNTGHCTTHHTNYLIFQPTPPTETPYISP